MADVSLVSCQEVDFTGPRRNGLLGKLTMFSTGVIGSLAALTALPCEEAMHCLHCTMS